MGFTLTSVFLALLSIITDTNGLSVNISPIPAAVDAGENLIVNSAITKTESESWKAFTFYVVNNDGNAVCRGAQNAAPAVCSDIFGCSFGFGFSCNYTHFNLHLNNVQLSMLGYSIYAEVTITGNPKVKSATTSIEVKIPLQGVSLTPNGTITKTESETQIFRCSARSLPLASLKWYLSGSMLPTQSPPVTTTDTVTSTCTYTVRKVDNGKKISCTAVYESTSFTEDALLNVQYRPIVNVSPNNNPFRVLENATNQQLTCNVNATNPKATSYTWKKDGSTISGTAIYTILTVHRSHTGSYTCGATNSVGYSDPSAAIQLEVLYGIEINNIAKKEPTEGSSLDITCSGQSYPNMSDNDVIWTKRDNTEFYRIGKQLLIENINRVDSGNYVCSVVIKLVPTYGQAINVTGQTTAEVDVLYRPNVTITPKYPQYNVIENTTNLVLNCTVVDANPAVTSYRWHKDGSIVHSSTDASYTISMVLRSHTGRYTCDATNSVGDSDPSADVQLNVLYGIDLNPIPKVEQTEGNQLNITCSGKSNPMMTENAVRWSKQNNNTFSIVGHQLIIDNVNRLDSGTYVCVVVTELIPSVGQPVNVTGKTPVEVDVSYRPDVTVSPDINPYHVKENTSNLLLTCNVTDANPAATSYRWYKDGITVSTSVTYTLSTVYRSHTGSYTCDATNTVGSSDSSSVLQLNVLYGVSLKLSRTKINIDEAERWDLSCIGDGNPVPNISCMNAYNSTILGKQQNNVTFIIIDNANCVDTGLYMCSGHNSIGQSVSQSAEIEVACKPRTYNNVVEKDIFINGTEESLNISSKFISFPLSDITWSRELLDGNLTDLDNEFISTPSLSDLPYETISTLRKDQLTKDEFGIYLVNATNIHGSFILKYHIIPKRTPDAPTNITARCGVTSIKVTWISRFNGGENQTFRMNFVNTKSNITISMRYIADKGENEIINEESEPLSPNTLYLISLEAENVFGTTNGSHIVNCTTKTNQENDQPISTGLVGGITGSLSALLIVIFVIGGLYWWRWRQVPGGDNELINRCSKEREEDEEGLKANPLYVTAEEASNVDAGPVYGVVNKPKKNKGNISLDENDDQGPIYSQLQKSNTQEKKQKDKKERKRPKNDSCKDIELGTVYENSDKLLAHKSHDELYTNAGEQGYGLNSTKKFSPQKNKDGLIYADLDLIPGPSGKMFVIRGLENRTNYAIIDLSKKAEPLPPDDKDEGNDNGNVNSHDNEVNE